MLGIPQLASKLGVTDEEAIKAALEALEQKGEIKRVSEGAEPGRWLTVKPASKVSAPQETWTPIAPVPETAPDLTIDRINQLAPPGYKLAQIWTYRVKGELWFYVARFEREGNPKDKTFRPFTFCPSGSNQLGEWRSKALPAPRPLYNLDKLAERPDAPVIVTEGEKKSDAAASLFPDYVAINSSGGAKNARGTNWDAVRGRDVVIWRDNDQPGKEYEADVVKLARASGAESVRVVDVPSDFPDGWDLADDLPEGVTQDDLRRMLVEAREASEETETEIETAEGLPFVGYENLQINVYKDWLLKTVMALNEVSSWIAPPGMGKSALLTDIAIHVAAGLDWRGYRSKQKAAVIYFALERGDLVKRRLEAYKRKLGLHELPIAVVTDSIEIMSAKCVSSIVATIRAVERHYGQEVGLIIIDTFAKAIAVGGGDEDKAKDQNHALGHLREVQAQTQTHVAYVGHTGKDETRGARGSSAHRADVDLMIQLSGDDVKSANIEKANDQPDDGTLTSFTLESYHLGEDEDDDAITVGIVSDETPETDAEPKSKAAAKLNVRDQVALSALHKAIETGGEIPPPHDEIPRGIKVATISLWRETACQLAISAGNDEAKLKAFQRAIDSLRSDKHKKVGVWGKFAWPLQ
jgi:hypothetical protein